MEEGGVFLSCDSLFFGCVGAALELYTVTTLNFPEMLVW
jgi:hypothetical protein